MIGGGAAVSGIIGKAIDTRGSTEIGAAAGEDLTAATGKQNIFHGAGAEIVLFPSSSMPIAVK